MMITNTDFTRGARDVAEDKGIALHIVRPNFDFSKLYIGNRARIQSQIQQASANLLNRYIFTK